MNSGPIRPAVLLLALLPLPLLAQSTVEEDIRALENAILQRDEIIRGLINRLELLEGELETLKNSQQIQQIVTDALDQSPTEQVVETLREETAALQERQGGEISLVEEAFQRQLLDRGSLVLPAWSSVFETGLTTVHSSTDNILIDGFTIFPVLVVGDIVSEQVRKETIQQNFSWRMGLPHNFQAEVSVPWSYLSSSRVMADDVEENFYDTGFGDLELGLTYQLINNHDVLPDSTLSLRWKTTTGEDPYEFSNPENHISGSGFDALSFNYTAVTVSDPLAYYGGLFYTYNFPESKGDFGEIRLGNSAGYTVGASLAVNLRGSINVGFNQAWTSKTSIDGENIPGTELITSTFTLGLNYIVNNTYSINTALGIGLTADSPDFQFSFRVPIRAGF